MRSSSNCAGARRGVLSAVDNEALATSGTSRSRRGAGPASPTGRGHRSGWCRAAAAGPAFDDLTPCRRAAAARLDREGQRERGALVLDAAGSTPCASTWKRSGAAGEAHRRGRRASTRRSSVRGRRGAARTGRWSRRCPARPPPREQPPLRLVDTTSPSPARSAPFWEASAAAATHRRRPRRRRLHPPERPRRHERSDELPPRRAPSPAVRTPRHPRMIGRVTLGPSSPPRRRVRAEPTCS